MSTTNKSRTFFPKKVRGKKLIAIVPALRRESKPLLELVDVKSSKKYGCWEIIEGKFQGVPIVTSYTGCGKIMAAALTQLLITQYSPSLLLHYGTGGAVAPQILPADLVVASHCIEIDYHERMEPDFPFPKSKPDPSISQALLKTAHSLGLKTHHGPILCRDADLVDLEEKNKLWKKHKGLCICWEGIGVGRICNANKIPYGHVRIVTDYADDPLEAGKLFEKHVVDFSYKVVDLLKIYCSTFHLK